MSTLVCSHVDMSGSKFLEVLGHAAEEKVRFVVMASKSLESGPFCSALTGYLGGPFFRSDSINGVEPNAA